MSPSASVGSLVIRIDVAFVTLFCYVSIEKFSLVSVQFELVYDW